MMKGTKGSVEVFWPLLKLLDDKADDLVHFGDGDNNKRWQSSIAHFAHGQSESKEAPPEATTSDHGSSHCDELADDAPAATPPPPPPAKELPPDSPVFENLCLLMYRKGTKVQPPTIGVDKEFPSQVDHWSGLLSFLGKPLRPVPTALSALLAGATYEGQAGKCARCARSRSPCAWEVDDTRDGMAITTKIGNIGPIIPFDSSSTPVKVEASSTSSKPHRQAARRPLAAMTASLSRAPSKRVKLSVHPPSVLPPPRVRTAFSNNNPFAVIDAKLESIHSALGNIRFALSIIEGSSVNAGKGKKCAHE
ncbi:hypothetical protein BV22DRAFT_1052189 [Leucogyrophana mollusca]|uniref:Uncharacterized protein n=1 Tax=Leucogyrophana mollusca TaxID=85980 RepID=A0ACB8AXU9_9AGAM|nr:hypothetical protein BV22DRAFT_1052189 [Leucogyrophana mollusca]